MKHPEEYVKLYRAETPYGSIKASPIPHLDTITEFEAKKTKKVMYGMSMEGVIICYMKMKMEFVAASIILVLMDMKLPLSAL